MYDNFCIDIEFHASDNSKIDLSNAYILILKAEKCVCLLDVLSGSNGGTDSYLFGTGVAYWTEGHVVHFCGKKSEIYKRYQKSNYSLAMTRKISSIINNCFV